MQLSKVQENNGRNKEQNTSIIIFLFNGLFLFCFASFRFLMVGLMKMTAQNHQRFGLNVI